MRQKERKWKSINMDKTTTLAYIFSIHSFFSPSPRPQRVFMCLQKYVKKTWLKQKFSIKMYMMTKILESFYYGNDKSLSHPESLSLSPTLKVKRLRIYNKRLNKLIFFCSAITQKKSSATFGGVSRSFSHIFSHFVYLKWVELNFNMKILNWVFLQRNQVEMSATDKLKDAFIVNENWIAFLEF